MRVRGAGLGSEREAGACTGRDLLGGQGWASMSSCSYDSIWIRLGAEYLRNAGSCYWSSFTWMAVSSRTFVAQKQTLYVLPLRGAVKVICLLGSRILFSLLSLLAF